MPPDTIITIIIGVDVAFHRGISTSLLLTKRAISARSRNLSLFHSKVPSRSVYARVCMLYISQTQMHT